MTLNELIEEFEAEGISLDTPIVLSSDSEGNGYSPLSSWGTGVYDADSTYSGQMYNEDEYDEYGNGDGIPVVCLWPTN